MRDSLVRPEPETVIAAPAMSLARERERPDDALLKALRLAIGEWLWNQAGTMKDNGRNPLANAFSFSRSEPLFESPVP